MSSIVMVTDFWHQRNLDWSKPLVFDDYSNDVRVYDMMIVDVNQDSDIIDHPVFDECVDVDIEKM